MNHDTSPELSWYLATIMSSLVIIFSEEANISSLSESRTPANKAEWEQCLDSGRVIAFWHCSLWFMTSLMSLSPLCVCVCVCVCVGVCVCVCVCVCVLAYHQAYMRFRSSTSLSFTSLLWLTLAVTLEGPVHFKPHATYCRWLFFSFLSRTHAHTSVFFVRFMRKK